MVRLRKVVLPHWRKHFDGGGVLNDKGLMSGSHALKEGLGVDWILTDYFGRPMHQPPGLGAIQYLAPNNPPVLIPAGNRSVRAGETIRIEIQAQDADADPLEYTAIGE